jgi:hypothetical protein
MARPLGDGEPTQSAVQHDLLTARPHPSRDWIAKLLFVMRRLNDLSSLAKIYTCDVLKYGNICTF